MNLSKIIPEKNENGFNWDAVPPARQTMNNNTSVKGMLGLSILLGYAGIAGAQYSLFDGKYGSLSVGLQVQMASLGEINNRSGDPT